MARATSKSRQVGAGSRSNRKRPTGTAPPRITPARTPKAKVVAPQPKPQNIVEGPTFKGSQSIIRPDGVIEVLLSLIHI